MRILIVEDEKKVAAFIKKGLEEETYAVDIAMDGEEGLYLGEQNQYDLIILDLMLPKINGLDILSSLRSKEIETPILLLTAKDSVEDKVEGLKWNRAQLVALERMFKAANEAGYQVTFRLSSDGWALIRGSNPKGKGFGVEYLMSEIQDTLTEIFRRITTF